MSSEARAYIQDHTNTIAPLSKEYSLRMWELALDGNNPALEKALVVAKQRYLKIYNNREDFQRIRES